jgi:hypothetical protein
MHHLTVLAPRTLSAPKRSVVVFLMCVALATLLFALVGKEAWAAQSKVEAETMTLSGSSVVVQSSSVASGGQEVAFFSNGSASSSFDGAATNITLRGRGGACRGNPQLKATWTVLLRGRWTSLAAASRTTPLL